MLLPGLFVAKFEFKCYDLFKVSGERTLATLHDVARAHQCLHRIRQFYIQPKLGMAQISHQVNLESFSFLTMIG